MRKNNKFIISFVFSLFLFLSFPIFSQTYLGNYTSHSFGGNTFHVFADSSSLKFTFYKPNVVRVDFLPSLGTVSDSSFVVIQDTSEIVSLQINNFSDSIIVSSSELQIICNKYPLRISFKDDFNRDLLTEPISGGIATNNSERKVNFLLSDEDHFYGTGERGTSLDKKGQSFFSYNTQVGGYISALSTMNINVPFLANSKGYAIYFDNTYIGYYDLGDTDASKFSYKVSGGELSYYFIAGKTIPEQLQSYTWLTGRQPLPPRWAFGYIQSKFGYENEGEARFTVQTLRQREIPADAIILDLYWFEHMGDISWDFTRWFDPFQMMADFLDEGIKTIVITEPYIVEYSNNFQQAISNGYLAYNSSNQPYLISNWWSCGCNAGLLDLTNPSAQQWWWQKHPTFFGNELKGIWTDLGEPENHPEGMNHFLGSRDKVHNIYNLLWAETIFNGYSQFRPNERLFNLTRSGFAGIQRYGVIPWSGDVGRDFGGLAVQLPMLLNMGISGLAYHNSDIGGFCCGFTTPELYVRWMQYGTFCPVTRAHGVGQPTEPWGFGTEAEDISKKFIKLRYKLLPYIYSLAYENYKTGMPLARPLYFYNPDASFLSNHSSSYMWGDALLVSPVVTEGAQSKNVYLPDGNWINYWNDELFTGGQTYNVNAPLDLMPLFVRAGSIIPMQPDMDYTNEFPLDTLILSVYPQNGNSTEFTLYEDDGNTLEYQNGNFAETSFQQQLADENFTIEIGASVGTFNGKITQRTYLSEVHRIANKPTIIFKDSNPISMRNSYHELRNNVEGYYFDPSSNILYVQIKGSADSSYTITGEGIVLGNIDLANSIPVDYHLSQNYPNPFNPSTKIRFTISSRTEYYSIPRSVSLKVYDVLGNEVATLVNEELPAGDFEIEFNGNNLSSGVYFYQLRVGDPSSGSGQSFIQTKKMILLR